MHEYLDRAGAEALVERIEVNKGFEKTTYAELVNKVRNAELVPGRFYRFTYELVVPDDGDVRSAGHKFDLIVKAVAPNKLAKQASATVTEGDKYFIDNNLAAWVIWYDINNDGTKYSWADANGYGVIYRMIDEFGNDCGYDFKNMQFPRYLSWSEAAGTHIQQGFNSPPVGHPTARNRTTPAHAAPAEDEKGDGGLTPFDPSNPSLTATSGADVWTGDLFAGTYALLETTEDLLTLDPYHVNVGFLDEFESWWESDIAAAAANGLDIPLMIWAYTFSVLTSKRHVMSNEGDVSVVPTDLFYYKIPSLGPSANRADGYVDEALLTMPNRAEAFLGDVSSLGVDLWPSKIEGLISSDDDPYNPDSDGYIIRDASLNMIDKCASEISSSYALFQVNSQCKNNVIKPYTIYYGSTQLVPNNIVLYAYTQFTSTTITNHGQTVTINNYKHCNCYDNVFENGCYDSTILSGAHNNIFGPGMNRMLISDNWFGHHFILSKDTTKMWDEIGEPPEIDMSAYYNKTETDGKFVPISDVISQSTVEGWFNNGTPVSGS